jgi:release factor glutamine methyltransferase
MVIANPPYISSLEMTMLPPEIIGWEARSALHGGLSGTDFYPGIIDGAAIVLRKRGILALEMGESQGEEISGRMEDTGLFDEITIKTDLTERPRYIYCFRNSYALK